ncbi:uncharacterized protein LOC144738064 isoform X1 [Lampetra planeri]
MGDRARIAMASARLMLLLVALPPLTPAEQVAVSKPEVSPRHHVVHVGGSLSLRCVVHQGSPPISYSWLRRDASSGGILTATGVHTETWTLHDARHGDAVACEVNNNVGGANTTTERSDVVTVTAAELGYYNYINLYPVLIIVILIVMLIPFASLIIYHCKKGRRQEATPDDSPPSPPPPPEDETSPTKQKLLGNVAAGHVGHMIQTTQPCLTEDLTDGTVPGSFKDFTRRWGRGRASTTAWIRRRFRQQTFPPRLDPDVGRERLESTIQGVVDRLLINTKTFLLSTSTRRWATGRFSTTAWSRRESRVGVNGDERNPVTRPDELRTSPRCETNGSKDPGPHHQKQFDQQP